MKLTLLSPYMEHLIKLRPKWEEEVKAAGLVPGFGMEEGAPEADDPDVEGFGANPDIEVLNNSVFKEDDAKANGSSIAFLLEHDGKTALLAGDAYPGTVLRSLNVLFDNKARVDVFKLSHHGSSHNTSPALIEKVDCKKYVISTNGAIFKHPSPPTMSWVIKRSGTNPELIFNYTTEFTSIWNSLPLEQQFNYSTTFPADEGIEVRVGN